MKGRKFVNEHRRRAGVDGCLFGPHVIESWLTTSPGRLRRVLVKAKPQGRLASIAALARANDVDVEEVGDDRLAQAAGTPRHQGVVGLADEFPYAPLERVLAAQPAVLVVLDQIQDPRNLGAILRTAAAVSVGGVLLPKDGAVGVTATVEVASAGATARLPIVRVTNLVRAVGQMRDQGYWAVALDARADVCIFALRARGPILLVVGGEGGVRPLLLRSCDEAASIPMPGAVESLNVSVAAGVALYEIHRQRAAPG